MMSACDRVLSLCEILLYWHVINANVITIQPLRTDDGRQTGLALRSIADSVVSISFTTKLELDK